MKIGWGLRAALVVVVGLACVLAAVQGLSIGASDQPIPALGVYWVLIGLVSVVVGAGLWDRRRISGTGPLLVVLGWTILVAAGYNLTDPWAALTGSLFATLPLAALLHVILTFPSGRLDGPLDRALAAAIWLTTLAVGVVETLTDPRPGYPLAARDTFGWLVTPGIVLRIGIQVITLAAVLALARRWWRLGRGLGRGPVGVVYLYGVATLTTLLAGAIVRPALGWSPEVYFLFQVTLIGGFPLVVAAALRFGALARSAEVDELALWFGVEAARRPHPRDALARALGDPSLAVVHESPSGSGRYVDHEGRPQPAPEPGRGRGVVTLAQQRGEAFVVYDVVLLPSPEPVVRAAQVAALAVDHERLTAELLDREAELRHSRRRLVEAGAAERRRLAQDLHDGVQARLVLAAMHAGRLRLRADRDGSPLTGELADLAADLDRAISELRQLVEGVMPALLREQGLFAALDDRVGALPLPSSADLRGDDGALDPAVATAAWFIAAEAISNALKHSGASRVDVTADADGDRVLVEVRDDGVGGARARTGGRGLAGMADRAAALGGWVHVDSGPDRGTCVRAHLPSGATTPPEDMPRRRTASAGPELDLATTADG